MSTTYTKVYDVSIKSNGLRPLDEKKKKELMKLAKKNKKSAFSKNDNNNVNKLPDKVIKLDTNKNNDKNDKDKKFTERIKKVIQMEKEKLQFNRERNKLLDDWRKIMAHTNTYNELFDTFEIVNEAKTSYGWEFKLIAPPGLSYKELEKLKPVIESNLGCIFMYNVASSNKYATCKVIYEELVKCNEIPFEPVKVKPYEICPGVKVTGEPLIIDLNVSPHVLIAGQTRRGKNGAFDIAILSWMDSCSEKEIEFYLFQCAKIDLIKYKNCKHVKCFIQADFNKMLEVLRYIVDYEIPSRLDLFEEMFTQRKGENIYDYNKLYPDKKLPYIYIVIDEFVELMFKANADKEEKDTKEAILDYIKKIGQMGAAVGVQYIILHQKPQKELCPPFIKNMSSVRICFGFEDEACGRVVLGDKHADLVVGLPPRRAYVNNNGTMELMFTTNLKDRRDIFIRKHEVADKPDIFEEIRKKMCSNIDGLTDAILKELDKNLESIELNANKENKAFENSKDSKTGVIGKVIDITEVQKRNASNSLDKVDKEEPKQNISAINSENVSVAGGNSLKLDIEGISNVTIGANTNKKGGGGVRIDIDKNVKLDMDEINRDTNNNVDNIQLENQRKARRYMDDDFTEEEIRQAANEIIQEAVKNIPNFVPYQPKEGEDILTPDLRRKAIERLRLKAWGWDK